MWYDEVVHTHIAAMYACTQCMLSSAWVNAAFANHPRSTSCPSIAAGSIVRHVFNLHLLFTVQLDRLGQLAGCVAVSLRLCRRVTMSTR